MTTDDRAAVSNAVDEIDIPKAQPWPHMAINAYTYHPAQTPLVEHDNLLTPTSWLAHTVW